MTEPIILIDPEEFFRHRWRDVDGNVDRFNAALEEWVRRGEDGDDPRA